MNRHPDEHRTPNVEHRTSKGACASSLAFGVRRSVLDVRCSSPVRFMASIHVQFLEVFPTHEPSPRRTPNAQHRTPNIEGRLREPLGVRRSVLDVRCSSPVRFMASIHVRILEVSPTHEPSPRRTPNAQRRTPNIEGSLRELSGIRCSAFGVGCSVFVPRPVHGLDSRPIFGGVPYP